MTADRTTRNDAAAPILGALAAIGMAVAVRALRSKDGAPRRVVDRRRAFAAYLRDHLSGSNAAIRMVERLSETHRGTPEGAMFASLHDQFRAERVVVYALLGEQGVSPLSIKRLAGRAAGIALRTADGNPGDLSLFRGIEALAIAVQGKRCLWRAAQALPSPVSSVDHHAFEKLEADAVRQWEEIERFRLSLVAPTFSQHQEPTTGL